MLWNRIVRGQTPFLNIMSCNAHCLLNEDAALLTLFGCRTYALMLTWKQETERSSDLWSWCEIRLGIHTVLWPPVLAKQVTAENATPITRRKTLNPLVRSTLRLQWGVSRRLIILFPSYSDWLKYSITRNNALIILPPHHLSISQATPDWTDCGVIVWMMIGSWRRKADWMWSNQRTVIGLNTYSPHIPGFG